MIDDAELADYLRGEGLLSDEEIEEALALGDREDRPLYEIVIEHGFVDEAPVVYFASRRLNVEAVDPSDIEPAADILGMVPRAIVLDHQVLPLEREETDDGPRLVLAMRDPIDMFAMDDVAVHTDVDIRPVLAGPNALQAAIDKLYGDESSEPEDFTSDVALPEDSSETSDHGVQADPPGAPEEASPSGFKLSGERDITFDSDSSAPVTPSDPNDAFEHDPHAAETVEGDAEPLGRIPIKQVAVSPSEVDEEGNPILAAESSAAEVAASGERSEEEKPEPVVEDDVDTTAETIESTGEIEAAVAQIESEYAEGDDDSDDEEKSLDDKLSSLRQRLGRGRSKSKGPTLSSDFIDRIAHAAGGLDDRERDRFAEMEQDEFLSAVALALVDAGILSVTDILEHSGE